MARRERHEEHHNHERWVVSYADFITLLFAFFVVMYAISSVNEGKYRVLSDSLQAAFTRVPGTPPSAQPVAAAMPAAIPAAPLVPPPPRASRDGAQQRLAARRMREIADEVVRALAPLARTGEVRIRPSPLGIAVEISAGALFATGEARLAPESAAALRAVAGVLGPLPNAIRIEGHTDDAPIATAQFPSNWELASARASAVARLFIDGGVVPGRLVVTGHADTRPVETNASPEGRARNRRVTVVILSQESVEPVDTAAPPAETP